MSRRPSATHGPSTSAFERLRAAYLADDVCLFVGAGVSMGSGLPGWKELARDVVDLIPRRPGPALGATAAAIQAGRKPPPDPNLLRHQKAAVLKLMDPLLSMRYVRADPDIDVRSLVSDRLYRRRSDPSPTAREIPMLHRVTGICCYNYDDVLDRAFAERRRACVAVFENERFVRAATPTPVFYVHGFLPDPSRRSHRATDRIVLSEDDYHELYRDVYAWANVVQLTLLLNHTALFVGHSLRDPNLRRLLALVSAMRPAHRHYALLSDGLEDAAAPWYRQNAAAAYRSVEGGLLAGLGVEPVWVNGYSELPRELRRLRACGARGGSDQAGASDSTRPR
jgi:hypothetical protein